MCDYIHIYFAIFLVRMSVDVRDCTRDWPDRWNHVRKLLEQTGPLAHPDFEPGEEVNVE